MDYFSKQATDMAAEFADQIKKVLPQVTVNRNGYEIRASILHLAKEFTEFEFSSKWLGFQQSVKQDPETGEIVAKVEMPSVPGADYVLETAEKFYSFINKK